MESWLQTVSAWLPSGWLYYTLIGTISFLESVALVGIFVPGSVLIVFVGFLATHGKGDIVGIMTVSALGALVGDLLSYWAGARIGSNLLKTRAFQKRLDLLQKARSFFISHGGKSVFFGRFIGFLRPFIPFVAGCAHMAAWRFALYAAISGLLWGLAYPGLGYFFGASWQMVKVWTGRFSFLIAALLILFVLNGVLWKWILPPFGRWCAAVWGRVRSAWGRLTARPAVRSFAERHPRLWSFLRARFTLERGSGLYLTTGFAVSALFGALFILVVQGIHLDSPLVQLDQRVYELLRGFRYPASDLFFVVVTYLGSAPVIFILGGLALLWLILTNRDFSATILVAGTAGGELLVFILKSVFQRPRPVPLYPELKALSASFPSAHAFVAMVFFGFLVYLLLGTVRNWQSRFNLVLGGSFLVLLIGFSRIYLGVHWLSDVLGGLALAAVWLTFLVTTCEMRFRYGGEFPWGRGWRPINLPPRIRRGILVPAALAALWGIYAYIDYHLPEKILENLHSPALRLLKPAPENGSPEGRRTPLSENLAGFPRPPG